MLTAYSSFVSVLWEASLPMRLLGKVDREKLEKIPQVELVLFLPPSPKY